MTFKETNEALYWAERLTISEKKAAILEAKKKKYFETKHGHKWPKDPYESKKRNWNRNLICLRKIPLSGKGLVLQEETN